MNSVLISIKPQWVEKIARGKKIIEVRKTRPTIETPFKCYIYCTKGQELWGDGSGETWKGIAEDEDLQKVFELNPTLMQYNGKVIGEFVCDKIDIYVGRYENKDYWDLSVKEWEELKKKSCLTIPQILEYTGDSPCCYGWHISDLVIYDKPKELSEFIKPLKYDGDGVICGTQKEMNDIYEWDCETLFKNKYPNFDFEDCKCEDCPKAKDFYRLVRPPQSWCYVEYNS